MARLRRSDLELHPPTPSGLPKGVVISHSNIVHAVVGTKDRLLTYLPNGKMAGHVFQVRCRPYRQEGSRLEPAWRALAQHTAMSTGAIFPSAPSLPSALPSGLQ